VAAVRVELTIKKVDSFVVQVLRENRKEKGQSLNLASFAKSILIVVC
jgi:hypothetical protein